MYVVANSCCSITTQPLWSRARRTQWHLLVFICSYSQLCGVWKRWDTCTLPWWYPLLSFSRWCRLFFFFSFICSIPSLSVPFSKLIIVLHCNNFLSLRDYIILYHLLNLCLIRYRTSALVHELNLSLVSMHLSTAIALIPRDVSEEPIIVSRDRSFIHSFVSEEPITVSRDRGTFCI